MATEIYNTGIIYLVDGTELEISPLKIKYLRKFMNDFEGVRNAKGDIEAISALAICGMNCMKQYMPKISRSIEDFDIFNSEDNAWRQKAACKGITTSTFFGSPKISNSISSTLEDFGVLLIKLVTSSTGFFWQ
mgnify:CR=1 FL=1